MERKTTRPLAQPVVMETTNGDTDAKFVAGVLACIQKTFVTAMAVNTETPSLLFVGSLVLHDDITFSWTSGRHTVITPSGKVVMCEQCASLRMITAARVPTSIPKKDLLAIATGAS